MIIKVDDNTFIKYSEATKQSQVLNLADLEERKEQIDARLEELNDFSDEHLLAWAKANYPMAEGLKEKASLETELQSLTNDLNEIEEL